MKDRPNTYACQLCSIEAINGQKAFKDHLVGRRHRKMQKKNSNWRINFINCEKKGFIRGAALSEDPSTDIDEDMGGYTVCGAPGDSNITDGNFQILWGSLHWKADDIVSLW